MRTAINFEAKDFPLEEVLFSSLRFKIPRYQRPFMWQEDHLSDFWNDLTIDDAPVFIGSVEWDKLLDNVWTASVDYNKLLSAGKDLWIDLSPTRGPDMYRSVIALRHMGVMQCHVFLLSLLRNIKKLNTDPRRIFELVEKFSFNYAAICKLPANKVENLYSNFANQLEKAINSSSIKHRRKNVDRVFSQLESELKKLRPSFEVFHDRFMEVSYGSHSKGRSIVAYILEKIERHKSTGEKKTDFDLVNIEHILPRNPSKAWKTNKKQIKNYVNNLGTLTLVHKTFNSKAGNKGVEAKLKEFKTTEMFITKELVERIKTNICKWDEEEINKRQMEFAHLAYNDIWNY